MEAGNRCFDFRVPEEINRKIIDHLSDINLTYTEHARRNLLSEGLPTEQIFVTGSPQTEVLAHYQKQIEASDILKKLNLEKDGYFVASFHREENVDNPERLSALVESINALAVNYDKPVILSVHPRTKQKLDALQVNLDERVRDLKPLGFFDYVQLQRLSYCTLSDSGTITEESAVMGFPAVTLRDTHERPEGMDAGVLVMTGISAEAVLQGVAMAKRQFEEGAKPVVPLDYQPTDVSWKVAKLIQSYVPYVRYRTWGERS